MLLESFFDAESTIFGDLKLLWCSVTLCFKKQQQASLACFAIQKKERMNEMNKYPYNLARDFS